MINLYHILGLEAGADATQIKRSFRQLAKKYHPDVNPEPSANEKFNEVYMAYEILGDTDKKRLYDGLLNDSHEDEVVVDDYQEEFVGQWQRQAYKSAQGYGGMSYADFRRNKIRLHQWSKYLFFEILVTTLFVLLLAFAILSISSALPYEGDERQLSIKERQLGFGVVVTLVCTFVLGHFVKVQRNNYLISKD